MIDGGVSAGDRVRVVNPRDYYMWETGVVNAVFQGQPNRMSYDVTLDVDGVCWRYWDGELERARD